MLEIWVVYLTQKRKGRMLYFDNKTLEKVLNKHVFIIYYAFTDQVLRLDLSVNELEVILN